VALGRSIHSVRIVCGLVKHRANGRLDGGRSSWPFGRVELHDEFIHAYTPVFRGRFDLHIPYSGIQRAVASPSGYGGRLRLQCTVESGDLTIATPNGGYQRIAQELRGRGVHVVADD
jgi:hypothetical protein